MKGFVVHSLPRLHNLPASGAVSLHLSQQAPRERWLLIGCGEQAALPAAVTQGFRCEARAGEAVRTSAVGCVPRRLEGRSAQRVCGPGCFRPLGGNHADSARGLRYGWGGTRLRLCAHARAGGARRPRARGAWVGVCARAGGSTWGRGGGESSVQPRQSWAGNLSRARPVVRGVRVVPERGFSKKEASPPPLLEQRPENLLGHIRLP